MTRASARCAVATLGFLLAIAGSASANGEEFFAPAKNGKIDLVYYGRIKDGRTGRSVTDSVYFLITDKHTGLTFPFTNDKPGHFRSPDIGTAIKEIGEQVDVKGFEVVVNVGGYKRTTITQMPRKSGGTVELDVRLEPIEPENVSAAGLKGDAAPPYGWLLLIGAVLVPIAVKWARGSRRSTTTH